MTYRRLFGTAFVMVSLVSAQTVLLSNRNWPGIAVVGFFISFAWFSNARNAARSELPYAREVYATGAMLGSVCGAMVADYFGR